MSLTWEQAHNIAIVRYLSREGIFPVYCSCGGQEYHYHSPIRDSDHTPSFHVNIFSNKWHDKGNGQGGDIIELVVFHKGMTRSAACHWLSRSGLYTGDYVPEPPTIKAGRYYSAKPHTHNNVADKPQNTNTEYAGLEADTNIIIDSIQPLAHPLLQQYLNYRRIDTVIAQRYGLLEINYQRVNNPDTHYFALAWRNDSQGCEYNTRVGQTTFKGCLGTKDITSINLQPGKKLAVFEAALDFWAYLGFYGIREFQNSAIILNSIHLKHRLIDTINTCRPSDIYLFLDNDDEGNKVTTALCDMIEDIPVHDKSYLYKQHKDFNAMVMSR